MRAGIYIDTTGGQICQSRGEAGLHHYRQGLSGFKVRDAATAMAICEELVVARNGDGLTGWQPGRVIPPLAGVDYCAGRAKVQATYYREGRRIVMNCEDLATLLHELAHHIADYAYPRSKAHGREFKGVLSWVYRAAEAVTGVEIVALARGVNKARVHEDILLPGTRVQCGGRKFTILKRNRTRYKMQEDGVTDRTCTAPRSILEVIQD